MALRAGNIRIPTMVIYEICHSFYALLVHGGFGLGVLYFVSVLFLERYLASEL